MNIEKHLRTMAKSNYWQRIYRSGKKCNNLSLFLNTNNFSGIQALFLYWLELYDGLYSDLASKEYIILDEDVINDDVRCDAFLYWKKRHIDTENSKARQDNKSSGRKNNTAPKGKDFKLFQGATNEDGNN
jgi:hypothetical protein